jgi:hypothetical protein
MGEIIEIAKRVGLTALASATFFMYGCGDSSQNPFKNTLDTKAVMQFLGNNSYEENEYIRQILKSQFKDIKNSQDLLEETDYPELTISAHLLDVLDLDRRYNPDYVKILENNPSMITSTTHHLIRVADEQNKSYEDIINYLGIHNSITPYLKDVNIGITDSDKKTQTRLRTSHLERTLSEIINTQEQLFSLENDNFYDVNSIVQRLATKSAPQNSYNEIITPACNLLSIIEKADYHYFDDVFKDTKIDITGTEKLSKPIITMNYFIDLIHRVTSESIEGQNGKKDELSKDYKTPSRFSFAVKGIMNSILENSKNYSGLESEIYNDKTLKDKRITDLVNLHFQRANDTVFLLSEQFPELVDPHSFSAYATQILEKDVPINALKHSIIQTKKLFTEHSPTIQIGPSKIINDALKTLENLTLENFTDDKIRELESPEYSFYKNIILNIPLVKDEMSKYQMGDVNYLPVKQTKDLIKNIRATCKKFEIDYTERIADNLATSLEIIGNLVTEDRYISLNQIYQTTGLKNLGHFEELLDEIINNSVLFTIDTHRIGIEFKSASDYLKFFEQNTKDMKNLAYPVKNSLISMEGGKESGWSINAQKRLLQTIKSAGRQVTIQNDEYLNPEKVANAMVTTMNNIHLSSLNSFNRITTYLSDLCNQQPNFAKHVATKDIPDPNLFIFPGIRAVNKMKKANLSLEGLMNRAKKDYDELTELKQDMQDRPFLYKHVLPIGVITPEKVSLEMEKEKLDNFFTTSSDPILKLYKTMLPDSNIDRLLVDNPNIAQVNINKFKIATDHLSMEQRLKILSTVYDLSLTKDEFENIDFPKIHTDMTGRTYQKATTQTSLFTELLFNASTHFAELKYLMDNKADKNSYLEDALNYLSFINRECKDDRSESRLLYVSQARKVLDKGYEIKGYMPNQLKVFASVIIGIPEEKPNENKFTPSVQHDFRSIDKVSNSLVSWIESDKTKGYDFDDLFNTLFFTKLLSYQCEKKKDPNAYLIPATHLYYELKNFVNSSNNDEFAKKVILGYEKKGITDERSIIFNIGEFILREANNPPVTYPKPSTLVGNGINIINDMKDRKYGIFPN